MFRWCAYCWRFLGERAPISDLSTTHGICESCVAGGALDVPSKRSPVAELHARLARVATTRATEDVEVLLADARAGGIEPLELLVAVMQPALFEIGKRWEVGEIDPAREARLTRLCLAALQWLEREQRARSAETDEPPVLLLRARGNAHEIGTRMLAFALRESGRPVKIVPTPPEVATVVTLCEVLGPSALGISVALEEQLAFLGDVAAALEARDVRIEIVAGGGAITETTPLPVNVRRWRAGDTLRSASRIFSPTGRTGE